MQGELVFTTTPDHVRLHGLLSQSHNSLRTSPATGMCDAAILLHGLGGNFYSSRMLIHFAQTLKSVGLDVVLANTRGHDMIHIASWAGRAKSSGAAFEQVSQATADIDGWVEFLRKRGNQRILLFGHSLGAIKSLYAQAHQPNDHVHAVIGLSPTRLSYQKMVESPKSELFLSTFRRCIELIAEGQGGTPVEVEFPFPTWMTPSGYVEKYGPPEKYNWLRFADRVEVPALLMFGSRELDENAAFAGLRGQLDELRDSWSSFTLVEIDAADHFYTSQFDAVDQQLVSWLTGR